jgi:hypothetical protein
MMLAAALSWVCSVQPPLTPPRPSHRRPALPQVTAFGAGPRGPDALVVDIAGARGRSGPLELRAPTSGRPVAVRLPQNFGELSELTVAWPGPAGAAGGEGGGAGGRGQQAGASEAGAGEGWRLERMEVCHCGSGQVGLGPSMLLGQVGVC